jgi:hypothetical protein
VSFGTVDWSGAGYLFGGSGARCNHRPGYALFDASSRVASSSVMRRPGPGSFRCADEAWSPRWPARSRRGLPGQPRRRDLGWRQETLDFGSTHGAADMEARGPLTAPLASSAGQAMRGGAARDDADAFTQTAGNHLPLSLMRAGWPGGRRLGANSRRAGRGAPGGHAPSQ